MIGPAIAGKPLHLESPGPGNGSTATSFRWVQHTQTALGLCYQLTLDRASATSPFYLGRPAHPSRGQKWYPSGSRDPSRQSHPFAPLPPPFAPLRSGAKGPRPKPLAITTVTPRATPLCSVSRTPLGNLSGSERLICRGRHGRVGDGRPCLAWGTTPPAK